MTTSPRVIAVVPAHNEAKTIGAVVASLAPHVAEVIVVDDASSDATGAIARDGGAVVLRNDPGRGYDGAIDRGFAEAAARGADIVFTFDADGEHDAGDLPRMLGPLYDGTADMVAGQRPDSRHWGERIFALYTRLRFGIRDPLCGFKAYRREVYDAVGRFDSVRSIGTELMVCGLQRGFRVACVPITLHERVADTSRFYAANLRGNIKILRALVRVAGLREDRTGGAQRAAGLGRGA